MRAVPCNTQARQAGCSLVANRESADGVRAGDHISKIVVPAVGDIRARRLFYCNFGCSNDRCERVAREESRTLAAGLEEIAARVKFGGCGRHGESVINVITDSASKCRPCSSVPLRDVDGWNTTSGGEGAGRINIAPVCGQTEHFLIVAADSPERYPLRACPFR